MIWDLQCGESGSSIAREWNVTFSRATHGGKRGQAWGEEEARTKGLSTACCATRQRLRHHTMVLFAEATHIDFGLVWDSIRRADQFRLSYIFRSRTAFELKRRGEVLLRNVEKELEHRRKLRADRAAARRSKAPDLAASVEKDRARQKLERRRAMSIRDRMESAEQRRKSNSKLRDNLRDKYALPKK